MSAQRQGIFFPAKLPEVDVAVYHRSETRGASFAMLSHSC